MFQRFATPEGTAAFAARFTGAEAAGFYRRAQSLAVSTLGIGTYLGEMNDTADDAYAESIRRALAGGINFIDTSLNYRHQRSERAVAKGVAQWIREDAGSREEIVICTKAGFLVPDAIPAGIPRTEVVGGMHCLHPAFLADQLERSRTNLDVGTVDVFYLHNPETQLPHIGRDEFYRRIRAAFERLERAVESGAIRWYGAATWEGFRRGGDSGALSLVRMHEIAREIAGQAHHFRFVQLPVNLAMTEAWTKPLEDGRTVMDLAAEFDITVVASASLLQARLARSLPDEIAQAMPGTNNDAQRAIQFARSVPGLTTALVGMSNARHVQENLGVSRIAPLSPNEFQRLFA